MRPFAALVALGAFLACLVAGPAMAGDVEIRLKTGERIYGELLDDGADSVSINRKVWTKNGQIAGKAQFVRTTIAEMTPVTSLDELCKKREAETPDTFDGQFSLAKWCFDRGLQEQAFTHAKRLYDRDPTDQVSKDLLGELGYVLEDGQWIKESEYAAKHGLVSYDGKLLTPAQVDLRKASIKADVDRDNAIAHQRTLDGNVTAVEKRVADAKLRVEKLKQQQADLKQAEAKQAKKPQGGGGGGRNQQQQQPQGGVAITSDYSDQIKQLDKSIAEAQKSVDAANKDLTAAKDAQAKGKDAVDLAQKAADAARQAVADSMPKDDKAPAAGDKPASDKADAKTAGASKPADAAKPTDAAKPVGDAAKPVAK